MRRVQVRSREALGECALKISADPPEERQGAIQTPIQSLRPFKPGDELR